MARSRYEYSTSPRKLEPDIRQPRQSKRGNLKVVKEIPRQEVKISKGQRQKQTKLTILVIAIFALLLTISYRNSQINEKFSQMQSLKKELSALQKENEQLEVNIQNAVTLKNIEKMAKEQLGMQKLTNKQTLYVSLPKKDYVESAKEEVVIEKDKNWLQGLMDKIFNQ